MNTIAAPSTQREARRRGTTRSIARPDTAVAGFSSRVTNWTFTIAFDTPAAIGEASRHPTFWLSEWSRASPARTSTRSRASESRQSCASQPPRQVFPRLLKGLNLTPLAVYVLCDAPAEMTNRLLAITSGQRDEAAYVRHLRLRRQAVRQLVCFGLQQGERSGDLVLPPDSVPDGCADDQASPARDTEGLARHSLILGS